MTPEQVANHPLRLIPVLQRIYGDRASLSFSRYIDVPSSLEDPRTVFWVNLGDVCYRWFEDQLRRLASNEELALNSLFRLESCEWHFPMIDFLGKSGCHFEALSRVFAADFIGELQFFDSGRSLHAYGVKALTPEDWRRFMGSLLLCNRSELPQIIDARWVGHRLVGGYGALRWSNNTQHHANFPEHIRFASADLVESTWKVI